jgi:DNA-binding HxlR family transcriptional regulator
MKTYFCDFEVTMDVIGGKWKGLIVYFLIEGPKRTSELKRIVTGITQKMLIQTLRELEADGIVVRKSYNQVPPKVEYSLTELGESLGPIMMSLCNWGGDYVKQTFSEDEVLILNKQ